MGKAEGKAECKLENSIEIAQRLLKLGRSPSQVADITALPLEEIENLVGQRKFTPEKS